MLARLFGLLLMGLSTAGCSSTGGASSGYTRLDGMAMDDAAFRAVMAQCRAEAAKSAPGWAGGGLVGMGIAMSASASKEADILAGCMARNGYIDRPRG